MLQKVGTKDRKTDGCDKNVPQVRHTFKDLAQKAGGQIVTSSWRRQNWSRPDNSDLKTYLLRRTSSGGALPRQRPGLLVFRPRADFLTVTSLLTESGVVEVRGSLQPRSLVYAKVVEVQGVTLALLRLLLGPLSDRDLGHILPDSLHGPYELRGL